MSRLQIKFTMLFGLSIYFVAHSEYVAAGGFSVPWKSVRLVADNGASLWVESSPVEHRLEKVLFSIADRTCSVPSELMDGVYGVAPHKVRLNFSSSIPAQEGEGIVSLVEIVIPVLRPETPRFPVDFEAVEYWISGSDGCDISVQYFEYRENSRRTRITKKQVFDFEP